MDTGIGRFVLLKESQKYEINSIVMILLTVQSCVLLETGHRVNVSCIYIVLRVTH